MGRRKRKIKSSKPSVKENSQQANSLVTFASGITGSDPYGYSPQVSSVETLMANNRWYLLSNYRQLLAELYVEHGIVQTLVDQPVEDAFRAGFDLKTKMLDESDLKELMTYIEQNNIIQTVAQGAKWSRLFGGGGVIVITEQKPDMPLRELRQGDKLKFKSFDLWELYNNQINDQGLVDSRLDMPFDKTDFLFDYYGVRLHESRVLRLIGKEAPSFIRPRLRGWGMSELERFVRSFNSYMKNQGLIFELLDEAKIDIYKMEGFNTALLTNDGGNAVQQRVQLGNQIKNYLNAITMDKEDEYEQKQIAFSGLGDMLTQIRQGVAADLKMPLTKLFGVSSAGFNSGEDDIENYNSMVESEIRQKVKYHVIQAVRLCSQARFGIDPEDMNLAWTPLRMLNSEQEQNVKNHEFNRINSAYMGGGLLMHRQHVN